MLRVLRQILHLLSKSIDSWDVFKDDEILYFSTPGSNDITQPSWGSYLAEIDKYFVDLRRSRSDIQHQIELFQNAINLVSKISASITGCFTANIFSTLYALQTFRPKNLNDKVEALCFSQ